jgi:hypothetical protein
VDESWIAEAGPDGGIVRLIPRMHDWVNATYPRTKLAIGEYNATFPADSITMVIVPPATPAQHLYLPALQR